jgi:hypothetical protein
MFCVKFKRLKKMLANETRNKDREIHFSTNWNGKLHNGYFTTIRLASTYNLTRLIPGEKMSVWLEGTYWCQVQIFNRIVHQLDDMPHSLLVLDTGFDISHTYKVLSDLYKISPLQIGKTEFILCVLKKIHSL